MSQRFIRIAVVYLVIGAALGYYMGLTQNFALTPVHAHVTLAGWLTLAVAGFVYHLYPQSAQTRLARAHFWLHNIGLPVFMVGLALMLTGNQGVMLVIAVGASTLLVGLVLFAVNVLLTVKVPDAK